MYCADCGKPNAEPSAFCMYCGARLSPPPSLAPAANIAASAPLRRRRTIIPVLIAATVVAALVLLAVLAITLRANKQSINPRLVIVPSDTKGGPVVVMDLDGKQTQLDLDTSAAANNGDFVVFESAGADFARLLVDDRTASGTRFSSGYVWPSGRYAVLSERDPATSALVRFDLTTGESLELVSAPQGGLLVAHPEQRKFMIWAGTSSPDNFDVYAGDIEEGSVTALTEGADSAFGWPSADWQYVANTVQEGSSPATCTVSRMNGRNARTVTLANLGESLLSSMPISDNGERVFYGNGSQLYRVDLAGGGPQRIASFTDGDAFVLQAHPRTDRLLIGSTANNSLILVRADGSDSETLVRQADRLLNAEFAPNDRYVWAWYSDNSGDNLTIFDQEGRNPRQVFQSRGSNFVRWLADSTLLYTVAELDGSWSLYREDAAGKKVGRLVGGLDQIGSVAYAPDGYLAYAGASAGQNEIGVLKLPGGKPVQIQLADGAVVNRLFLAPRGRAVYQTQDNNHSAVYVADLTGKTPRLLVDDSVILATNLYQ
jgi:Tol biopolymer transport system component